jgi:adenylate cyclase class 2
MKKELEIRYHIEQRQKRGLIFSLEKMGWIAETIIQEDIYFCAKEYVDSGKTKNCPYVLRIRKSNMDKTLTYKSFDGGDGSSWIEIETKVENHDSLKSILINLKQEPYLSIKKHRLSGHVGKIEINIDKIDDLGNFIELEIITDNESGGRKTLMEFSNTLGLSNKEIIKKGYVQLMESRPSINK